MNDKSLEQGFEYLERTLYSSAEAFFEQAVTRDPENGNAWLGLAIARLELGQTFAAKKACTRAIALDVSDTARALTTLGGINFDLEEYDESECAYRSAIDIYPDDPRVWNDLGLALVENEKFELALNAYERAIELDEATAGPSHYNLGRLWLQMSEYDRAEREIQVSIGMDPLDSRVWNDLGVVLNNLGRNDEARDACMEAIRLDPDSPLYMGNLVNICYELEEYDSAESACLRLVKLESTSSSWYQLGLVRSILGDTVGSEVAYRESIRLDRFNTQAFSGLGQVLADQGFMEESERAFIAAGELDPLNPLYKYYLGVVYDDSAKYHQAERAYEESIALDDGLEMAWNNLGSVQMKLDNYSGAESSYRQAIDITGWDPVAWCNLALCCHRQQKYSSAESAALRALELHLDPALEHVCWYLIANSRWNLGMNHSDILSAYKRMSACVEVYRNTQNKWNTRLDDFVKPAAALVEAAVFSAGAAPGFESEALVFAVQSKARTLGELLNHDTSAILSPEETRRIEEFEEASEMLERERHDWMSVQQIDRAARFDDLNDPEISESYLSFQVWNDKMVGLSRERDTFMRQLIARRPEVEPFFHGPVPGRFQFSTEKLSRRLRQGEAVLEFLIGDGDPVVFMGFLITEDGLLKSNSWFDHDSGIAAGDITLDEFRDEISTVLLTGQKTRAPEIKVTLNVELLKKWGNVLYAPFIEHLESVNRLWISPHAFLTQLPWNAIPFPDGADREVTVIPSSTSLLRPRRKGVRPKPRYTLGVVAANSVSEEPLLLQKEEARRLRSTVRSALRRWELSDDRRSELPTLLNLQERSGLTRCLVLSCHGNGPNEGWGTLHLGTDSKKEKVTGRQLVDAFLQPVNSRRLEADVLITSACFTGQVDPGRPDEWLGLPLVLQTVWKTRAMVLTLWEVEELPAMIFVVEMVTALTKGMTAGQAFIHAQDRLRTVTREQIETLWLPGVVSGLSSHQREQVSSRWPAASVNNHACPFDSPVYWAPFLLLGDSGITVSPRRAVSGQSIT